MILNPLGVDVRRSLWIAGVLALVAASNSWALTAKEARYVTTERFDSSSKFKAEKFVNIMAALPALKNSDSALHAKIEAALKGNAEELFEPLIEYFALYPSNACVARQVRRNFDQTDFNKFYNRTVLSWRNLTLACAALQKKRGKEAVEHIDQALKFAPRYSDAYLHRAIARARAGDAAGAGADFREASKNPKGAEIVPIESCVCAASLAPEAKRLKDAFVQSEEAKKRGIDHFLKGDVSKALAKFDTAIKADPGDPESYASRAVAREKQGMDPEKAADDYLNAFRYAVAAGRWEMAADNLFGSSRLGGAQGPGLSPMVKSVEYLVGAAGSKWKRRGQVQKELKLMRRRLADYEKAEAARKTAEKDATEKKSKE